MLLGMILLPLGLIYGFSHMGRAESMRAMLVELTCLVFGAGLFLLGRSLEKRRT